MFVLPMLSFQVGDYVIDGDGCLGNNHLCFPCVGKVAYVGPICLSKPSISWIGVIWQCPNRGKNNGSLKDENGVHVYFHCDDYCGSFLQPSKLQKCISIQEAMIVKYMMLDLLTNRYKMESKQSYQHNEILQEKDDTPSSFVIQLVGMEQIAEMQYQESIITADLSNEHIVNVGKSDPSFSSVQSLDLSHNYIQEINMIVEILRAFPSLHTLSMNYNPLDSVLSDFSVSSNLEVLLLGILYYRFLRYPTPTFI